MTLRPARRRRYALSQYATVRGFSLWQQEWFGFFFPRRRRRPTNYTYASKTTHNILKYRHITSHAYLLIQKNQGIKNNLDVYVTHY